ncbi:unconventional myosin-IXb-like [Dendronephthya gigantea]|uniref:unconventional myosin-IXb-like n=1 Tax=Dendronephthya gigantea TaxID=151771 RepID=UPI00106C3C3B|nr:unconventional myosin-IXb-like [Dendronephthya gigantea]
MATDLVDYGLESERDLVRILYECFRNQQYFIQAGDILVTLNPWKRLEGIEKEVVEYCGVYRGENEHHTLPPHPCSVAENAVRDTSDGVIIPLGESGSGKSTNIEMILRYLSLRADSQLPGNEITAIIEVFNLFCNAKTLICNNSTRCFKVYELSYSMEQKLLGVNVNVQALQKMRLISQIKGESNFNIFHRLLDGLSSEAIQEYCLQGEHRYVPSLTTEAVGEPESSLPRALKCLEKIGLDETDIEEVLRLISGIILLGDLQFGQSTLRKVFSFSNGEVLEKAASLVGVPSSTLADLLIVKSKKVKGEKVNILASCSKALYECDCLAVTLYETLIMWLEERINSRYTSHSRLQSDFSLVLLDVFGWENYSVCSFEQLCINTVNEALQSTYNAVVFTTYQMELENENIFLHESCLKYDQPGAVPLLLKPKGLLDILHSNVEKNDQKLSKKLDSLLKKEARYIVNNNPEVSGFLIEHFIDEVQYDTNGFVANAQNWLNDNALSCLRASKNKVVSVMAQERINRENTSLEKAIFTLSLSSKKAGSIVEKDWLKTNIFPTNAAKDKKKHATYRNSNPAVLTLSLARHCSNDYLSEIHFIRCINSNLGMHAEIFDDVRVLRQVQWSNLLGTVKTRISCLQSCFPIHKFITRYKLLFFYLSRPVRYSPDLCYSVLSRRFDESEFKVGKTKVFLKRSLVSKLDKMLEKALYNIVLIQKVYRGYLDRRQYQAMIKIKKTYDVKRSFFLAQITNGVSKFHDHLSFQIREDQTRLKQNKLKELAKYEPNNSETPERRPPLASPDTQGKQIMHTRKYIKSITFIKR